MPDDKPKCGRPTKRGSGPPCKRYPIAGATVCKGHGGGAPQVKAKAAVRAEVMRWGLGDAHQDPGEVLLRLVTQSAQRCALYSRLLEEAYDAAERLRRSHDAQEILLADDTSTDDDGETPAIQQARLDLERVFLTGGVAALVGHTIDATSSGHLYATGEAIRGLADLEAKERDRCAGFAAKAITAGLAKRQVELAERQGQLIADVLRTVLADKELGLTAEQRRAIPDVARRALALVG